MVFINNINLPRVFRSSVFGNEGGKNNPTSLKLRWASVTKKSAYVKTTADKQILITLPARRSLEISHLENRTNFLYRFFNNVIRAGFAPTELRCFKFCAYYKGIAPTEHRNVKQTCKNVNIVTKLIHRKVPKGL